MSNKIIHNGFYFEIIYTFLIDNNNTIIII